MTDTRQASTLRLCQSITAARYTNPLAIGMYVISIAHTWLGLLTSSPRSRYGYTVWPGRRRLVLGFRYSASMPIRRISVAICVYARGGESLLAGQASHHLVPLLRQSIYSRLAGYDDTNDAVRLSQDPAMRVIVGWQGSERKRGGLVCLNSAARFDKWNRAAVR